MSKGPRPSRLSTKPRGSTTNGTSNLTAIRPRLCCTLTDRATTNATSLISQVGTALLLRKGRGRYSAAPDFTPFPFHRVMMLKSSAIHSPEVKEKIDAGASKGRWNFRLLSSRQPALMQQTSFDTGGWLDDTPRLGERAC